MNRISLWLSEYAWIIGIVVGAVVFYFLWGLVIWPVLSWIVSAFGLFFVAILLLIGLVVSWAQISIVLIGLPVKLVSAFMRLTFFFGPMLLLAGWDFRFLNVILDWFSVTSPIVHTEPFKLGIAVVAGLIVSNWKLVSLNNSSSSEVKSPEPETKSTG